MAKRDKPWILLLEDEQPDQEMIVTSLNPKQEDIYNITIHDNWADARMTLDNRRFDLVIADIFIYQDARDKQSGERGNYSCLENLLECAGSRFPPVPVIVYTGKVKLTSLHSQHPRISDYWEKPLRLDPEFYEFRVRKILELAEREHPSTLLMKIVLDRLRNLGGRANEVPWADIIVNLIEKYERYELDSDRADIVSEPLSRIASQLYFSNTFRTGFKVLKTIDLPSNLLLPGIRPHYLHCLNTFLLGYFLFNLADIDWKGILVSSSQGFQESVKLAGGEPEAWAELNASWFAAALLHDVGLAIEYYKPMSGKLQDAINLLEVTKDLKACAIPELADLELLFNRMAASGSNESVISFIRDKAKGAKDKIDHGIASAIFLAKRCYNEVKGSRPNARATRFTCVAAEAIALHNLLDEEDFPELDFSKNPVSCMLAFCDAIQAWDRQRPDSGLLGEGRIAKVELCELNSFSGRVNGPHVSGTLKYIPHSTVVSSYPLLDQTTQDLQKILQDHVKNPLSKRIRFTGDIAKVPQFDIKFKVGQETIDTLMLPVRRV